VNNEYAKSMNKVSELMIASTSHDMRTPINTTLSMINLLEKATLTLMEKKWLKVAKTSLSLLLSLINDTLDYY
jgi:signal transduction histidine kinase